MKIDIFSPHTATAVRRVLPPLFLVLLITGCDKGEPSGAQPPRNIRAMIVGDLEGITGRTFPGRAQAAQEVDLAFRVAGEIATLNVKVGDNVNAGDLIASLDPRDFDVAVRNADANLERARATERGVQVEYERMANLQKTSPGAISENVVDQAREAVGAAKADVSALEASADAANDALGDTRLTAPFAGTVVATHVENFENVRAKQMVVRLLDSSHIEFEIGVPETLISMAQYVEDITVTFDAFPDVNVPARTTEIGSEASATTRTFPVTLRMEQPEGVTILPGMAGRARGTPRPPDAGEQLEIIVPVTAIFGPEGDQSFVWVIDASSNTVDRREVQVGYLVSAGFVIESGLEQGDVIATAGVHFLKQGQEVLPAVQ